MAFDFFHSRRLMIDSLRISTSCSALVINFHWFLQVKHRDYHILYNSPVLITHIMQKYFFYINFNATCYVSPYNSLNNSRGVAGSLSHFASLTEDCADCKQAWLSFQDVSCRFRECFSSCCRVKVKPLVYVIEG